MGCRAKENDLHVGFQHALVGVEARERRLWRDAELLIELLDVAKNVAAKIVEEKGAARLLTNLGDYQDSKHLHFHVYSGEKIR